MHTYAHTCPHMPTHAHTCPHMPTHAHMHTHGECTHAHMHTWRMHTCPEMCVGTDDCAGQAAHAHAYAPPHAYASPAGEKTLIKPVVRDEFGNGSAAPIGSLRVVLDEPHRTASNRMAQPCGAGVPTKKGMWAVARLAACGIKPSAVVIHPADGSSLESSSPSINQSVSATPTKAPAPPSSANNFVEVLAILPPA